MSAIYFAIPTNAGQARIANAIALGIPLKITHMAIGDGNGKPVTPNPAQKSLAREVRRAPINTLFQDPLNPAQLVAEQVIPEDAGGWWVREVGLYDDSGTMIAVANCPDSYKPVLSTGAGRTQVIRMALIISDTSAVELKIDPAVVLATRKYVDDMMAKIAASTGDANVDSALYDLASAAYAIKNRRLLGIANNKLRSGEEVKIVCVGDSITYGYDENSADKIPPAEGHVRYRAPIQYPSRLEERLNKFAESTVLVKNYGYSGDTAKQGYDRWKTNPGCHVAHIMFGINDSTKALFTEYREYMEKLIRRYIDWGHGVVIHTSSAQRFNNNDSGGTRYTQYIRSIATSYGCPVFESEGVHQSCKYSSVYSDGTHFNKAGYAKYGDAVAAFILAGSWVRPIRNINAYTRQQAGRATEGIGWFMTGGAYTTFNEKDSYMWHGQTGGINGNTDGIHSFSFFLDAEAANVYAIGNLDGAIVCLSDPVTTVDGKEAVNETLQKSAPSSIAETKSYTVSARPRGYKQWIGALVGRGWKTVYMQHLSNNEAAAYLNDLIIEPCTPEMVAQTNASVMPATREVMVFNCPVQPIESSILPPPAKMPLKVYFPLPKGLYRQSQVWTNYYDNLVLDISILTKSSDGGATYNGIHKISTYTASPGYGVGVLVPESTYKSQQSCIGPTSIKYGWEDPNNPGVITEGSYPQMAAARMYLIFTFPDAPAAYYSLEVQCSSIMNGAGTFMY
ncbi:phage tail protein [Aeromonas dhakensis]|uniref:phage tail-collar fiber domain-containing protein n=1 Tax=Aeromonas dhakensis TaxID=196024 RepID=UPI00227B1A03|nr:phage tail protein [Aeromonas dhakensis]WAF69339.1 phage tail protein [Aeromonas dhakensis]